MSTTVQINSSKASTKEMPHNIEAEQGLLGAILLNNDILFDISEIIETEHFFEDIHKKIYEVINKIVAKGQLATPITLKNYFEIEKNLEEIGGSNYLARLARKNPKVLQNLCMFLSIDLQLEQEELKRAKKKSKGN